MTPHYHLPTVVFPLWMLHVTPSLITPIHSADTPTLFTFQQGLDDD